jgi:hypothetical protein
MPDLLGNGGQGLAHVEIDVPFIELLIRQVVLVPDAAMINTEEWRMWTNKPPLSEFGYFYVALFLAGNYARYYPDLWLLDVERSSPLALAIEELCTIAEWRVPWLSLSELGRVLLVQQA